MNPDTKQAVPSAEVKQVNLLLLKPYWRNPRKNDAAVDFLTKAIPRFGFLVPLVIDAENVIITGHSRYRAAMRLNMQEVPCIQLTLNQNLARQFRIADNKISEKADWDQEKLTSELLDLANLAELSESFDCAEWRKLVEDVDLSALSEDADPTPTATTTTVQAHTRTITNETAQPASAPAGVEYSVLCPHCGQHSILVEGVDL